MGVDSVDPNLSQPVFGAIIAACLAVAIGCIIGIPASLVDEVGHAIFDAHGFDAIRFALPLFFSRCALPVRSSEALVSKIMFGTIVAAAAICNLRLHANNYVRSFGLLFGVQAASYIVLLKRWKRDAHACLAACACGGLIALSFDSGYALVIIKIVSSVFLAYSTWIWCGHCLPQDYAWVRPWITIEVLSLSWLFLFKIVLTIGRFFLPVDEVVDVYAVVSEFVGADLLDGASLQMLIITLNTQVPLGYLGLAYLRHVQEHKNKLIEMGHAGHAHSARAFVGSMKHLLIAICLPFVLQRAVMNSVHSYAFGRFRHWTERSLRLHSIFPEAGSQGTLLRAVAASNFTVETYANAINGIVESSFGMLTSKLLALPKLMLVPGVLTAKPWLLFAVLPASVALDVGKAHFAASLTMRIEALHRELMELASRRRRMELHDMKHEELIQRGRAAVFAEQRWRELGDRIEDRGMRLAAIQNLRSFVDTVYNDLLLHPAIDCALAFLMEVGYTTAADIGLYTSVIENAIATLLTRHREQATLANMETKVDLVRDLASHLAQARLRARPRCSVDSGSAALRVSTLEYSRGQTHVNIPELHLDLGRIYAVTGANGCGKSTALAILACCGRQGASLPTGAEILDVSASIVLPADDVVEIAQNFYCPVFSTPMSWLLQQTGSTPSTSEEAKRIEERAVSLMREFGLLGSSGPQSQDGKKPLSVEELWQEREDWYSELSGGEKCKVEFIRKVFMLPRCPTVLLIDEAFAPLDPVSKQAVRVKLQEFCSKSLVLVVHHGGEADKCVDSEGFFDDNLHFQKGTASVVGTC